MQATPACVTESVCPPAVIVAVRALVVVFADTTNATDALPLPLVAPSVSQVALLDAVHAQPDRDVMVSEPFPPAAVKLVFGEERA